MFDISNLLISQYCKNIFDDTSQVECKLQISKLNFHQLQFARFLDPTRILLIMLPQEAFLT